MHWNEPGTFSPDNVSLLLSGSVEKDAQGMDIYKLNIQTGRAVNLTNSPTVSDEHGVFSPDSEKIIFMSAHPYRADPSASNMLSIKTEFMLMNEDGTGLTQLTHIRSRGIRNRRKASLQWVSGIMMAAPSLSGSSSSRNINTGSLSSRALAVGKYADPLKYGCGVSVGISMIRLQSWFA